MGLAANVLVGLVALIHIYFLVLEMFLWRTPVGRRIFGTDQAFADQPRHSPRTRASTTASWPRDWSGA